MGDVKCFIRLGEKLISWNVIDTDSSDYNWYFPTPEIQKYLLPIINVGGQKFDEYGRTIYIKEDCVRLKNTVAFAKETLILMPNSTVRYETIDEGLVSLNKREIILTLDNLAMAVEQAIEKSRNLLFLGD